MKKSKVFNFGTKCCVRSRANQFKQSFSPTSVRERNTVLQNVAPRSKKSRPAIKKVCYKIHITVLNHFWETKFCTALLYLTLHSQNWIFHKRKVFLLCIVSVYEYISKLVCPRNTKDLRLEYRKQYVLMLKLDSLIPSFAWHSFNDIKYYMKSKSILQNQKGVVKLLL